MIFLLQYNICFCLLAGNWLDLIIKVNVGGGVGGGRQANAVTPYRVSGLICDVFDSAGRSAIMVWDDQTKKWSKTGDMKAAREHHGVSAIDIDLATLNACQ